MFNNIKKIAIIGNYGFAKKKRQKYLNNIIILQY